MNARLVAVTALLGLLTLASVSCGDDDSKWTPYPSATASPMPPSNEATSLYNLDQFYDGPFDDSISVGSGIAIPFVPTYRVLTAFEVLYTDNDVSHRYDHLYFRIRSNDGVEVGFCDTSLDVDPDWFPSSDDHPLTLRCDLVNFPPWYHTRGPIVLEPGKQYLIEPDDLRGQGVQRFIRWVFSFDGKQFHYGLRTYGHN